LDQVLLLSQTFSVCPYITSGIVCLWQQVLLFVFDNKFNIWWETCNEHRSWAGNLCTSYLDYYSWWPGLFSGRFSTSVFFVSLGIR
jgi:hypothetical protein